MKQLRIITSLLLVAFFAFVVGSATGLSPVAIAGGIVALSLFVDKPNMALFTAIDTTELAEVLGDYYRENRDILVPEVLLDPNVTEMFDVYDDVRDELPLPNLEITDIIKPGVNKTFQPTANALKFGARILKVRDVKIDLQILPTDLHKKWLAYRLKARRADGSADIYEIPFEAFIMNYITLTARNQLYLQAIFNGTYNASGTTPVDTMTGFLTLVESLVAEEDVVPVSIPDITSTNVIESLEAVYDGLGEAYKGMSTEMKVSPTIFDWYNRRYRGEFGANQNYTGMNRHRIPLDGSLCDVVREPGMAGSGRVICSPKENFAYGCDTISSATMEIQKNHRFIDIMGDFKAGVEFKQIHSRVLSVNELESDDLEEEGGDG